MNNVKTVYEKSKGLTDNVLTFAPNTQSKMANALAGTTRALVNNMVLGVTKGFEKQLEIQGVGYKANLEGDELILDVGYSHQVKIKKPEDLEFSVSKNIITISGADKQLVGEYAARIRSANSTVFKMSI